MPAGEAEKMMVDGDNIYGGKRCHRIPRAACLAQGPPAGATGLAQCYRTGPPVARHGLRQAPVENVQLALQHNLGLGGACVVTLYGRG